MSDVLTFKQRCGCDVTYCLKSTEWNFCWCSRHVADTEAQEHIARNAADGLARYRRRVTPEIRFLKLVGVSVSLDWDDSLIIGYPDGTPEKVRTAIAFCEPELLKEVRANMRAKSRVCVGGPCNGQPYFSDVRFDQFVLRHLKRACWAIYRVKEQFGNDRRAFYIGQATSKKKALALTHQVKP